MKECIIDFIKNQLKNHYKRSIGLILGLIISLSIVNFGFFKTLFVIVCMGIGLYLGNNFDDDEYFGEELLYKIKQLLPHRYRN